MSERLKVSDFYGEMELVCAKEIEYLEKAFFQADSIYYTTKDASNLLHQYSLPQKTIQQTISLPLHQIKAIKVYKHLLCLVFEKEENLWLYDSIKKEFAKLHSHYLPITAITIHEDSVLTGSADMTIRVWKEHKRGLLQDNKLHILSGHGGQITCFLSINSLLLSAAKDKSLIAWRHNMAYAKKSFPSHLLQLAECEESSQLIAYQQNETINVLSMGSLVREGRIEISRVITGVSSQKVVSVNEMDDSFVQVVSEDGLQIVEINLGVVVGRLKGRWSGTIVSKCLRRMTMLAINGKGLYFISF